MKKGSMRYKVEILSIVSLILSLIIILNSFKVVTAESEGSVTSFGEVKKGKILTGFNWVAPWWSIDEYNNLLETVTLEGRGIPSQDKFKTEMDISYTGKFIKGNADKIRSSTGTADQFKRTHVDKKVRSCAIGAGTRVNNSQAFFEETTQAEMTRFVLTCVNDYLNSEEVGGGFQLTQVQFTNISLDPIVKDFMVTTKQRQEQEEQQASSLKIADLKAQEVTKVAAAKEQASLYDKKAAQNRSDAKLYDMKKEAEGNLELSKSLSNGLIRYMEAKKWDGVRSKIVAGGNTELLVDSRGD